MSNQTENKTHISSVPGCPSADTVPVACQENSERETSSSNSIPKKKINLSEVYTPPTKDHLLKPTDC